MLMFHLWHNFIGRIRAVVFSVARFVEVDALSGDGALKCVLGAAAQLVGRVVALLNAVANHGAIDARAGTAFEATTPTLWTIHLVCIKTLVVNFSISKYVYSDLVIIKFRCTTAWDTMASSYNCNLLLLLKYTFK